ATITIVASITMIARERLRTSRMRSCFRSILADPVADAGAVPSDAGPDGLPWLSPDIETAPRLFEVLKHSRKRDAPQPMRCETSNKSAGKTSVSECQRIVTREAIEPIRDTKLA